jgi:hypothetical protein
MPQCLITIIIVSGSKLAPLRDKPKLGPQGPDSLLPELLDRIWKFQF